MFREPCRTGIRVEPWYLDRVVRTLKVKCPTWEHVETFYKRKLRRDRTLTIRVPFNPVEGSGLTIKLQLPDGQEMHIEGKILGVLPGTTGGKTAITLHLHGLDLEVESTLRGLVEAARKPKSTTGQDRSPKGQRVGTDRPPPAPMPAVPISEPRDAPIDELVQAPYVPDVDTISEFEREVFLQLEAELVQLREFAANEVLGIPVDAEVNDIRHAYFARSKHFHPDLFAKYRSRAITHMAQEVFIHMNRAYDRMRDAAVRDGRAVMAGPALMPHDGWLASLDDISTYEPTSELPPPPAAGHSGQPTTQPVDLVIEAADEFLRAGEFERARSFVASALHGDPRNRKLRALYYLIGGKQALVEGDKVLAASQFEAALAHDRDYEPARAALDQLRARGEHSGVFKTLR